MIYLFIFLAYKNPALIRHRSFFMENTLQIRQEEKENGLSIENFDIYYQFYCSRLRIGVFHIILLWKAFLYLMSLSL